jgi:hypothetical protein
MTGGRSSNRIRRLVEFLGAKRLRRVGVALTLVTLIVTFFVSMSPLMPYLRMDFDEEYSKKSRVVVAPQISTGVPYWEVRNGEDVLEPAANCDKPNYNPSSTFVRWPKGMSAPSPGRGLLSRTDPEIVLVGTIAGCRELAGQDFPIYVVERWVAKDKWVLFYTEAGRTPRLILFMTLGLLGLAGLTELLDRDG